MIIRRPVCLDLLSWNFTSPSRIPIYSCLKLTVSKRIENNTFLRNSGIRSIKNDRIVSRKIILFNFLGKIVHEVSENRIVGFFQALVFCELLESVTGIDVIFSSRNWMWKKHRQNSKNWKGLIFIKFYLGNLVAVLIVFCSAKLVAYKLFRWT